MASFSLGQIASIAHEANRQITRLIGDVPVQPPWEECSEELQASIVRGVLFHMNRKAPVSPEASHEAWMRDRIAHGWRLGPVKDDVAKTHPSLVPYDQLPPEVKAKDRLFSAICVSLMPTFKSQQTPAFVRSVPAVGAKVMFHADGGPYMAFVTARNGDGSVELVTFGRNSVYFQHNVREHTEDYANPGMPVPMGEFVRTE